jgi:alkylated DNA repair dioxygenase AlkB
MMQTQLTFFSEELKNIELSHISGLKYVPNFISESEEKKLLTIIDEQCWLSDLNRRVQHYGFKYDYRLRRIDLSQRIGSLPVWLHALSIRLAEEGIFDQIPDQVIINEYQIGQGITPHIDCEPCFGDTLVSLSLNSTGIMEFSKNEDRIPFLLESRSIVILKDAARYEWKHAIPARKNDVFEGITYPRKRRISLTFRKVIL